MAEPENIQCPVCSVLVPAATFCDCCGAELKISGKPVSTNPPAISSSEEPPHQRIMAQALDEPDRLVSRINTSGDQALRLEIDEMRIFITGVHSSFGFRIIGVEASLIHDLELSLHIHGIEEPITDKRRHLPHNEWNMPFSGHEPGIKIPARVKLSYHVDGRVHRYEGDFTFDCYPPEEQAGKIIENLVVKADENRSEYAATQNISVRVMENFTGRTAASLSQQMKDLRVAPVWRNIPLHRCYASDLEQLYLHGLASLEPTPVLNDRMTLFSMGKRVHVMSGGTVSLGRDSTSSDVPCRVYNRAGVMDRDRSLKISRVHARILAEPHKVLVADGGYKPGNRTVEASATGTRVNGKVVPFNKPCELPVDKPFTIELADFVLKGTVHSFGAIGVCPFEDDGLDASRPSAIVLQRDDGRPDVYCILLCAMPLKLVDGSFNREIMVRHQDGFVLATPKSARMNLCWMDPGQSRCPGLPAGWTIGPYEYSDEISRK